MKSTTLVRTSDTLIVTILLWFFLLLFGLLSTFISIHLFFEVNVLRITRNTTAVSLKETKVKPIHIVVFLRSRSTQLSCFHYQKIKR